MTALQAIETMQRARGEALVRLGPERLMRLRTEGSAKAILPGGHMGREVVFLNTAGGLTSGDYLCFGLEIAGRAVATTQTAERAYRANYGPARMDVRLSVGPGGWLDWLPQETILFDRAALDRRTVIELAPGAGCLALEAVVLGRAAMGETVRDIRFRDRREIRRQGVPLWLDPLAIDASALSGAATLNAARALASIVITEEVALTPLRAVLDEPGVAAGSSAFAGRTVVRLLAADGLPLRRQIARVLHILRRGQPLPRVWQHQGPP
ncbi:urease accessory protein UreD [Tabrizicola caldifontis]|uniref:urease accessory protein UreD n=1 Tax=Tabrizicola caldifontis TaxID=2528036 RepID=UPI001081A812|nr:urease accessory protein UreD [Rhodobacter sp. YIM 73028]